MTDSSRQWRKGDENKVTVRKVAPIVKWRAKKASRNRIARTHALHEVASSQQSAYTSKVYAYEVIPTPCVVLGWKCTSPCTTSGFNRTQHCTPACARTRQM